MEHTDATSSGASFPFAEGVVTQLKETASIYRLVMGPTNQETGEQKCHSLVAVPPDIPRVDSRDTQERKGNMECTYNICMFDVSGSMKDFWQPFVKNWNKYIRNIIDGSIDMYVFDNNVKFIHSNTYLSEGYFSGNGTLLSLALAKIAYLVKGCPHKHVRVFLVTDGRDSERDKDPLKHLQGNMPQDEKRIDVYILGMGSNFPVEISLGLRSRLHSGPTNFPTLFWAKDPRSVPIQVENLSKSIQPSMSIRLNKPALLMPGMTESVTTVFPGEYLYFEEHPESLQNTLQMVCEDEPKAEVDPHWKKTLAQKLPSQQYSNNYDIEERHMFARGLTIRGDGGINGRVVTDERQLQGSDGDEAVKTEIFDRPRGKRAILTTNKSLLDLSTRQLLDLVFKQWGSIILQKISIGLKVDPSIYELMEKIFHYYASIEIASVPKDSNQSIQARLERKWKGKIMQEFREFLSESKGLSDIKSKYTTEVQRANAILKTTVSTKYGENAFKVKGYGGSKEWNEDMRKFMVEYKKIKDQICALPYPSPDDSCRILLTSFLGDLQDSEHFEELAKIDKLTFLEEMTFTGVPVFSPIKDSTLMNPWTFQIRNIVNSPYEIICQRVLEDGQSSSFQRNVKQKAIYLKRKDEQTMFNTIIPIVPREHTQLLKPLLTSTIFAIACSYCVLKNATILDRNCHLAALASAWMRCVRDFPVAKRPEYICNRILNVEANAKVYMERRTIVTYIECLLTLPNRALQTEAAETFKDLKIKCESILKPCFMLQLIKDDVALLNKHKPNIPKLIELILMEFIGRCVSHYQSSTPFVDFFLPKVDSSARGKWLNDKCDEIYSRMGLTGPELLKKIPDLNGLKKFIKTSLEEQLRGLREKLGWQSLLEGDNSMDWEVTPQTQVRPRTYSSDEYYSGGSDMDDNDDDDEHRVYDVEDSDDRMEEESEVVVPKLKILAPNFTKIDKLRHSGSAGQIDWNDLKAWAQEMLANFGPQPMPQVPSGSDGGGAQGPPDEPMQTDVSGNAQPEEKPVCLIQEEIDTAFSLENVTMYLYHAIQHRSSRFRLLTPMISAVEAKKKIEQTIENEWKKIVASELRPMFEKRVMEDWLTCYKTAHCHLALPLTRQEIISLASARGVEVNEENFDRVYRYNEVTGLCRNACHVQQCPWFLRPNRHMNAHLEVERQEANYPHTLHLVVSRNPTISVEDAATSLSQGRLSGSHKRKKKPLSGSPEDAKLFVTQLKRHYTDMSQKKQ